MAACFGRVGFTRSLLVRLFFLTSVSLLGAEVPRPAGLPEGQAHRTFAGRFSPERLHSVIFAAIDLDHDGVISAAEMANAPTGLRALDLNEDGELSVAELRRYELGQRAAAPGAGAAREGRVGRVTPGFVLAFALDANRDGVIQAMEIANAPLSLRALDANADGQLAWRELRPAPVVARN